MFDNNDTPINFYLIVFLTRHLFSLCFEYSDASVTEQIHRPGGRHDAEYSADATCWPLPVSFLQRIDISQQSVLDDSFDVVSDSIRISRDKFDYEYW